MEKAINSADEMHGRRQIISMALTDKTLQLTYSPFQRALSRRISNCDNHYILPAATKHPVLCKASNISNKRI